MRHTPDRRYQNTTSPAYPAVRSPRYILEAASDDDRREIYRIRHEVYAREIGQHPINSTGRLSDFLDSHNTYIVARRAGVVAGFISITPPESPSYSIDKYFDRERLPFAIDDGTWEVRLLTVLPAHRGCDLAVMLMYAAFRWVESRAGRSIIAIGRREVIGIYLKGGLRAAGLSTRSGAVTYDLLHSRVDDMSAMIARQIPLLERLKRNADWRVGVAFRTPARCFHGGAFFEALGERFDNLSRAARIINADVLDAWFPPAPRVIETLAAELPWLLSTSPPTSCRGMIEAIAEARGLRPCNILPGAGSSDLMFRALTRWINPGCRALLLDPTYGEYRHLLEKVIGCHVDRLTLRREKNYDVPLDALACALEQQYDLVVIVNPNSPTGRHVAAAELRQLLGQAPSTTRVWLDETYIDYVSSDESLERFASNRENVVVCKSLSKVYALSGARAAYLCAAPHVLEELRAFTPPWAVSLPAQVAVVRALQETEYYLNRWAETHQLRQSLAESLGQLEWDVVAGRANFLLCHLPPHHPCAEDLVKLCREHGLFLRNAETMGEHLGNRALRIAVKDAAANKRIIEILRQLLKERGDTLHRNRVR
ncbi:MAG: aminotransferase class I/II-fold pyridoxal phosphate-dependent enzyme [Verrucomicrobiales bacterium]